MNETRPIPAPLVSLPFTECSEDDKEVGAALHSLTSGPVSATLRRVNGVNGDGPEGTEPHHPTCYEGQEASSPCHPWSLRCFYETGAGARMSFLFIE